MEKPLRTVTPWPGALGSRCVEPPRRPIGVFPGLSVMLDLAAFTRLTVRKSGPIPSGRSCARVAERQTRWLQVPVSERAWGFKSPLAHALGPREINDFPGSFFVPSGRSSLADCLGSRRRETSSNGVSVPVPGAVLQWCLLMIPAYLAVRIPSGLLSHPALSSEEVLRIGAIPKTRRLACGRDAPEDHCG
jgi:hypothetical protein